jgi:indole-3-glycerol phosphate synthase
MSGEGTYLDKILAAKRARLSRNRAAAVTPKAAAEATSQLPPTRDFIGALRQGPAPRIIAEFKRASPSAGALRQDADVAQIVAGYERAGAAAVSVLCDEHFSGSLDDLRRARAACDLPILCKDFILERSQILEARVAGADAVLLIVAALPAPTLRPLVEFAHSIGLAVLAETHTEHEIDRAMSAGARCVGVNARDLQTFQIDAERALRFRSLVPESFTYVAESGIGTVEDLRRLRDAGVDGALIGSALMASDDPVQALKSFVESL